MLPVDGVLDIETSEWDQFCLGGIMMADESYESFRKPSELIDRLLELGGTFWTWNGGFFDTLWVADCLQKRGLRFQVTQAGPRVTRLECEGLVVRDAIALIPMKLEKAAGIAGRVCRKETGLACHCAKPCGGYCSIRRDMPEAAYQTLDRYLRGDCATALAVVKAVIAEAERCEYLLSGTVGGTSYRTLSRRAEIDPADWPRTALYRLARRGYFGGRTEVFRPDASRGFIYDINSAYPAALTHVRLPTGSLRRLRGERAKRAFDRQIEGIYLVRVRVPADLFCPPLPKRTPKGRVCFPTGVFRGAWTALELRGAVERGCDLSFDSALVWMESEPVLAEALRHVWDCRARARDEGNDALSQWHKWVGNSFTGKLAEAPEKEAIVVNPADDEVVLHEADCECSPRWNGCRAWRPLDRDGQIWAAPIWRLSDCAHVHWAAYLTAWTRQTLLAQLEADGQDGRTAVYCDTDSCFATAERTDNIGSELGEWGSEGAFRSFEAIAPKVYRYWSEAKQKWVVRGKGLTGLDREGFDGFRGGSPHLNDRGVLSFRLAARSGRGLFTRKSMTRRNHADGIHFGGRIARNDGLTYPLSFQEVLRWEKESQQRPSARRT